MILLSREEIIKKTKEHNFKPEILEKVYRLLSIIEQMTSLSYLRDRLVLKGGTALNLFYFENIPRLSVDIDLNYIGKLQREQMIEERIVINDSIKRILLQNKCELYRNPSNHAGGKMVWRYPSLFGQMGNLEIDLNYMYRQPLWPIVWLKPNFFSETSSTIPVLDICELAAGKLSALFSRQASRDLFDAHYLLTNFDFEKQKIRLAFVIYIAMTEIELTHLNPLSINFESSEIYNQLIPVLRQKNLDRTKKGMNNWANTLLSELRQALSIILPLQKHEMDFINEIRTSGKILPELITDDSRLITIVQKHPAIQWASIKSSVKT